MKIMIASDIHGSLKYCRDLFEAYDRENAEKILLLGDILYHGPRNGLCEEYDPKAVSELLNLHASDILCIKGNCDSEVDQMVLDFPIMSETALIVNEGVSAILVHGHKLGPQFPIKGVDIVFSGHTHIPKNSKENGVIFANPGSISIPKENSPNGYIIWTGSEIIWKDIIGEEFDHRNL